MSLLSTTLSSASSTSTVNTFSLVTSVQTTGNSITFPTGTQAGDIAFIFNLGSGTSSTNVTPTGWTSIVSNTGGTTTNRRTQNISYKILNGTESGTITCNAGVSGSSSIYLIVFRGISPLASITVGSLNTACQTTTPTNQTLALNSGTVPILAFAYFASSVTMSAHSVSPTTFTDVSVSSGGYPVYVDYAILNSGTLVSNTVSITATGTQAMSSFYIQPTFASLVTTNLKLSYDPQYQQNNNTTIQDLSGNGNTGVLQSSPAYISPTGNPQRNYWQCSGGGQYISTTTSQTSPNAFTISAWFNSNVTGGVGNIIGFTTSQTGIGDTIYDRSLQLTSTGAVNFYMFSPTATPANSNVTSSFNQYNDGAWHQATATYDGTTMTLYVDGVSTGTPVTITAPTNTQTYTGYWKIAAGVSSGSTAGYMNTAIGPVQVYSVALSASQVLNNYNAQAFRYKVAFSASGASTSSFTTVSGVSSAAGSGQPAGPNQFNAATNQYAVSPISTASGSLLNTTIQFWVFSQFLSNNANTSGTVTVFLGVNSSYQGLAIRMQTSNPPYFVYSYTATNNASGYISWGFLSNNFPTNTWVLVKIQINSQGYASVYINNILQGNNIYIANAIQGNYVGISGDYQTGGAFQNFTVTNGII